MLKLEEKINQPTTIGLGVDYVMIANVRRVRNAAKDELSRKYLDNRRACGIKATAHRSCEGRALSTNLKNVHLLLTAGSASPS